MNNREAEQHNASRIPTTRASGRVCPKTGRPLPAAGGHPGGRWIFPVIGLAALLWFLIRVLPRPRRAAYPCQRVAAPLASTFVLWVLSTISLSATARKAWTLWHLPRWRRMAIFTTVVMAGFWIAWASTTAPSFRIADIPDHEALGVGRGIHPGRVVWVHDPAATDWAGYNSSEYWFESNHTDLAVVETMLSRAIRGVAGENTDADAWTAIFRHFNQERGKGDVPYQSGEKIAIKINLTTCNARYSGVNPVTYEKSAGIMNRIDNSPQVLLALLRQLVYTVGVAPADITVGDPTALFPNYLWNRLHPEFPEVHYMDNLGGSNRLREVFSDVPLYWSTTGAVGKVQDYIPMSFAEADYFINASVLKGHSAGITVSGKNLYGAMLRTPDGYLRDAGTLDYYDMHLSLPNPEYTPGTGHYRAMVDLLGHRELGGKTLLCLVDGLFAGYYWEAIPKKWKMAPFGDGTNADWPSTLFLSQDPVAIDSVARDFMSAEWPAVVSGGIYGAGALQGGEEDYLHEAALANAPPSATVYDPENDGTPLTSLGVHEHWNDSTNKLYGRNLGLPEGIELFVPSTNGTPLQTVTVNTPYGTAIPGTTTVPYGTVHRQTVLPLIVTSAPDRVRLRISGVNVAGNDYTTDP